MPSASASARARFLKKQLGGSQRGIFSLSSGWSCTGSRWRREVAPKRSACFDWSSSALLFEALCFHGAALPACRWSQPGRNTCRRCWRPQTMCRMSCRRSLIGLIQAWAADDLVVDLIGALFFQWPARKSAGDRRQRPAIDLFLGHRARLSSSLPICNGGGSAAG